MADLKYLYKNFRLWFTVKFCGKFFNLNYILNVLAYERYCDYAFYRNNCPLIAVITGMERSGTNTTFPVAEWSSEDKGGC